MRRLEPRDQARTVRRQHFAETHEGIHLVNVAPHGFDKRVQRRDVRIGGILQHPAISLQPPEDAIHERKAAGIAMQRRHFGERDERRRRCRCVT
jgi:hypothetical protein